jgi:hypothetical protein
MTLKLRISQLASRAGAVNNMTPSDRRLFQQSTKRPKWERKSAPIREFVSSASTIHHVKSLHNPRVMLRGSHLQQGMVASLAMQRS